MIGVTIFLLLIAASILPIEAWYFSYSINSLELAKKALALYNESNSSSSSLTLGNTNDLSSLYPP